MVLVITETATKHWLKGIAPQQKLIKARTFCCLPFLFPKSFHLIFSFPIFLTQFYTPGSPKDSPEQTSQSREEPTRGRHFCRHGASGTAGRCQPQETPPLRRSGEREGSPAHSAVAENADRGNYSTRVPRSIYVGKQFIHSFISSCLLTLAS